MIYSIINQKGGTGKTTTAAALLQAAAHENRRALAIDLDPQANLTFCLAADSNRPGSYELLHGTPAEETIQKTAQGVDVIAAAWSLQTETTAPGSARRLENALEPIKKKYDIIVIDTPPTPGEMQYNAMQAADGLIIPLQADIYNIRSLQQIDNTAEQIKQTNTRLKIAGVILTQYDRRPIINKQLKKDLEEKAAARDIPFLGTVRKGVIVQEAAALQKSLYEYAPKSKPAADYLEIYQKLIQTKTKKRRGHNG